MLRNVLLVLVALLATAACSTAARSTAAARPPVDLVVVDRDGRGRLSSVHRGGDRWIEGTPGHRYAVRLSNTTGERVLSIDGVNAVTGESAAASQGGYVLGLGRRSRSRAGASRWTTLPSSFLPTCPTATPRAPGVRSVLA